MYGFPDCKILCLLRPMAAPRFLGRTRGQLATLLRSKDSHDRITNRLSLTQAALN